MRRRTFLKSTGIALASALVAPRRALGAARAEVGPPLKIPADWPGGTLEAAVTQAEVWPGMQTTLWTYNGSWPGPTIRVRRGERLDVTFVNSLDEPTTMHWHGLIVPADMDGHPMDAVAPGATFTYSFEILNRAGTYWYHPHPHGRSAPQTYMGMAGLLIVEDDEEQALALPRGAYDVPLMIQDRHLLGTKEIVYRLDPDGIQKLNGLVGDTAFVNGTPTPSLDVDAGLYRLRIANASNARVLHLAFADGRTFSVIGSDGGLLDRPYDATRAALAPAERIEIVVDFSDLETGATVDFRSEPSGSASLPTQQGSELMIMTFVGTGRPGHTTPLPATLATIERYDIAEATRTQRFTFDTFLINPPHHKINGLKFDMHRVDARIERDRLEIWEFVNGHTMPHPAHVHGTQFLVIDRNGSTDLAPADRGWKDTLYLPGATHDSGTDPLVRVLVRFAPYDGLYVLHCHNLEHEDDGMMINFAVDRPSSADPGRSLPTELDLR